jgi:hypothetical protein
VLSNRSVSFWFHEIFNNTVITGKANATLLLAVLLPLVFISGCSGFVSGKSVSQSTPIPQLALSNTNVNFGNVGVGSKGTITVTVSNSGNADLNISSISSTSPAFALSGMTFPATISAGGSATLTISFSPAAEGTISGSLAISSNATTAPLSVPLSGVGMQTGFSLSSSSVNFGNVTVSQTGTQNVTLTNSGNLNLVVNLATVTGTGFGVSGLSLPASIAPSQSLMFSIQFAPTVSGPANGTIVFTDNAPNSPHSLSLSGSGVATTATLVANPTSIAFGSIAVGSNNKQPITLTNTGNASVTISQATAGGAGFSMSGMATPMTLQAGQNATLMAQFAPATTGNSSGSITVTSGASNPTLTVNLTGTGTQGSLSASPASFNFGNVLIGNNGTQTFTLTNSGTSAVTVSTINATGTGFSVSGVTTPLTLNPGLSTSFSAKFAPASAGNLTGSISITSNAPGSPLTIPLSGVGAQAQPQLTINPASVSFGSVAVGSTGLQSVTLSNTGNAALTITAATPSGTGFGLNGLAALPLTLNAGQSTSFSATFSPASAVTGATGTISLSSNAPGSPATISLTGSSLQGSLSANPASFNFGNVLVGSNGTHAITLTNSGTASVTISAAAATGTGFSLTGLSTPMTLTAGQSTTLTATFTPTSASLANGSVSITSNAPGSPLAIPLSGTGIQAQIAASPTSVNFATVVDGNNATQTITVRNNGTASLTISQATVSGTGFSMTGLTVPATIAAGSSTTFTAKFAPTGSGPLSGSILLTSNAPGSPLTIPLSGVGAQAQPQLTINPASVSFGSVAVGSTGLQSVTLSNTGNAALTITAATPSGTGFGLNGLAALPLTLNAGQSTSFSATFSPASAVTGATGTISLSSNAPGSPATISLTGSSLQGSLSANPASFNFGNVLVGSNGTHAITLTNSGTASVTISAAAATGTGFSLTGLSTPMTLTAGQSTTLTATFTPTSASLANGSVSITSNAPGSPLAIPLSGTGIQAQIAASPTSVNFATVVDGNNATQTITVRNNGTASLTISQATVSGTGFSMTGLTVPATIAAGSSTTFTAKFAPTGSGPLSGSILLTSNAPGSPLTIPLSGTAATATKLLAANPVSLSFGTVNIGSNSLLNATLTNTGNSNVTISSVLITGSGFTDTGLTANTILTPNQSVTLHVTFAPVGTAGVTGSVSVASDASNSPLTISLSGSGLQPVQHSAVLTWTGSTSAVAGYRIYRGTVSGGPYTLLNGSIVSVSTYTDTTVVSGQTYYYVTTAVDSSGNESVYSNEISATIP